MPALLRQSSADQLNKWVDFIHKTIGKDIGEETAHIGAEAAKLVAIKNPITPKIDTYEKFIKGDNSLQTRAFKSKHVNKPLIKGKKKLNENSISGIEIPTRFTVMDDKLIIAGRSNYPCGTKIKFMDDGQELTGKLTHPFGFCMSGDVGVYLDQQGVYNYDQCCLKNSEYKVDDPEAIELMKKIDKSKVFRKFAL